MTEQHLIQIRGLFEAALERTPETRLSFLRQACIGDETLLQEVQMLINAHEQTGGLLDLLPATVAAPLAFSSFPQLEGCRIGPYLIGREIGRGGMGIVYLALRADGAFQKQFAFKIVQSSLGSEELVARFQREREILGSLDHPNIARLIDAGATDYGLPYYVMEYIEGKPIDAYCDEHRLNVTKRLGLFRAVCKAVQYAHQNLIVHRDLKPSNILVAADGTIKLLDFGIAKLLGERWQERALTATATGIRLLTPEYASPEQIKGQPITTATDVYTLGVILYQLLTGHRPYRLKNRLLHEVERAICEEEPTRPSIAVDEVRTSDQSSTSNSPAEKTAIGEGTIAKLKSRLSGDIDNILLFALRKEPSRRYSSAEQFEGDLRRHLEGLPVLARKDTLTYRAQKFISRHRLPIAASSAFVLMLIGGLLTTLHLYSSAKAAQAAAEAGEVFAWAGGSLKDDPERALILGLYAWGKQRDMVPGLEQFFHDALLESHAQFALRVHKGSVDALAWSLDGRRLAVGGSDNSVEVWDTRSRRELLMLHGHQGPIDSIAWSPAGDKLATASFDGSEKIWELSTGRVLLTISGEKNSIGRVAWSLDGAKLSTARADTVTVWDVNSGRELLVLRGQQGPITSVTWSPDGSKLATASPGKISGDRVHVSGYATKIWDAVTGRELLTLPGNHGPPIAWSPDGGRLATAGVGYTAKILEAATGRELLTLQHQFPVTSIAWSPDGTALASSSVMGGAPRIWDLATGSQSLTLPETFSGTREVTWSPAGDALATANFDGTVKVWGLGSQDLLTLRGHRFPVESIAWSPEGDRLATGSEDGALKIWEAATGRELFDLVGHKDAVNSVDWSPDGSKLATASADGTAKVWAVNVMQALLTLRGHQDRVRSVAWSPDCRKLATASRDGTAKIWEAATGRVLLTLRGHQTSVESAAWSPDGSELATGSNDGTAKIWEVATGRELLTLFVIGGMISSVAWSPDGKKLATASSDGTARIWNVGSGRELLTLDGHHSSLTLGHVRTGEESLPGVQPLLHVAWSSDGTKLATASMDGTAKIWDAATGVELLTLHGHRASVVPELWSKDGRHLGSADAYNMGARQNVNSVQWSPDAKRLASAGDDSLVQVYAIDEVELLRLVHSRITRDLTVDECRRYLNLNHCPSLPELPESSAGRKVLAQSSGSRPGKRSPKGDSPYLIPLEAILMIAIMIQLLLLGDSTLRPDQKRRFGGYVEAIALHLSYLHPVRSLRILNTDRGRWILALLSAMEISVFPAVLGQSAYALVSLFGVFTGFILAHRLGFLARLSDHIFDYCLGSLEPCFEGIQGTLQPAITEVCLRIAALGVCVQTVMNCALFSLAQLIDHAAPYDWLFLPLILVLVPLANLLGILVLTLGFTFAVDLVVGLFRALAWRILQYNSGPFRSSSAILTAAAVVWAILLRMRS